MTKQIVLIIAISLSVQVTLSQNNPAEDGKNIEKHNSSVYISIPHEICITEGNRLEIFKHSIINAINPENYFLNARIVEGVPKGKFYDRVYVYDCEVGDENMRL